MSHCVATDLSDIPTTTISARVLLVEDNPGDAELTAEWLSAIPDCAFQVAHVTTLAEARTACMAEPPDAVLLDLNLSDSRELATLRALKRVALETPVIVVSGVIDQELREQGLREGADEVLSKCELGGRLFSRAILHLTERNQARGRHRQLERLLDATPDAILVVTHSGIVRYVNQAALRLFQRTRRELLGERLGFSVLDAEPVEITIPRRGQDRVCEMRVVAMEWNREPAYLASIRDITERIASQQLKERSLELENENRRIRESSRMKSAFLANMSHELRTPLNAIIGFSELIVDGRVDGEEHSYKEFVRHILNSGKHLLGLVNDVLDLAKVEAGKLEFRPERVALSQVVSEVVDALGPTASTSRIAVDVAIDAALEKIEIDPIKLKQVLYNYLSNALKFTPKQGRVTIRGIVVSDTLFRVEVEDSGIGIAPEDHAKLFREFQQINGNGRAHDGSGLGLALTKRIVEAQGGVVGVRSQPGAGSLFFAELPRRVPDCGA